jgi:large subunit ribosomal protein L25
MQTIELTGQKRDLASKGALRSLRLKGQVPSVIYGGKKSSYPLTVNSKEFQLLTKAHGSNVVVNLKVDSATETVLVKEVQKDMISREIIHIDFQRISLTDKIEVSVPLHVKGEAPGVKLSGGILEHILREVRVRCLPTAIPVAIDVDVSALQINQGLKMKDILPPAGVEVLTDPEHLVVNVVAPTELEEEPAPGAAPAATEPEVIAKGKKPEEGEEGAAAPAGKEAGKAAAPAAKEAGKAPAKEGK